MASPAAAALAAGLAVLSMSSDLAAGAAPQDDVVLSDAIPSSLTGARGDAVRGRAIVLNRQVGLCLLCHTGPFPEERLQGSIAPDLGGTGARLSEGQIRLRLVDPGRVNRDSIMPAYYRSEGLTRVAPAFRGKTILTAEQIEDVVAFLVSLK